ncbi:MAG: peptidylprolyl isomerase [Planctomycetota bacterium]
MSARTGTHRGTHRKTGGISLVSLLIAALLSLGPAVPVTFAQDGDAIALVNGNPISKRKMVAALLEAHGIQMLQQFIVLELAKEETARLSLRVSPAEIEQEFQRALDQIAPPADEKGKPLTQAERLQALELLLQRKGVSMTEFRLGMERNAHLRKAIAQGLRIDEALLREEYARLYGEKVEVRHIQVGDIAGLHAALNRLNRGEDFAEVARTVSTNAESAGQGGLLPPFTFKDEEVAPVLREAAFALQPGETSRPVLVGRWWHILKLERRLPSGAARFEDVRDKVEESLRDRVLRREMNARITELFKKANVRILEPGLKERYEKTLRESTLIEPTGP